MVIDAFGYHTSNVEKEKPTKRPSLTVSFVGGGGSSKQWPCEWRNTHIYLTYCATLDTHEKRSAHVCVPYFGLEFAIEIIRDTKTN